MRLLNDTTNTSTHRHTAYFSHTCISLSVELDYSVDNVDINEYVSASYSIDQIYMRFQAIFQKYCKVENFVIKTKLNLRDVYVNQPLYSI
jgi:hypothetical protein